MTVETARSKARRFIDKLASAENPAEARRLAKNELAMEELFNLYLADRKKAGKRSIKAMLEIWELYLGELPKAPRKKHGRERVKPSEGVNWSKKKLSEITTQRINTLHARIVAAGKAITANRVHELLRAVFGFAMRQKYIKDNPAEGITPAAERDRSRFLGKDELPRFIAALEQEYQPWRDYFIVLLYVGYRRAAIAAMAWRDIDLETGTWMVPGERAKNGDPIVLPVTGAALITLRRRWRDRESTKWVFPGGGKDGHVTSPTKAWTRVVTRAQLDDVRIHDLRRTLGSWLAMSGASLPAIGRALGHKDPRSTQVYARWQAGAVTATVMVGHKAMDAAARNAKVVPLRLKKAR